MPPVIEAEVKARVDDPERVLAALRERAPGEEAVYRDVYYDLPDRSLTAQGRELRVRVSERGGSERVVFTYKAPAVDEETGSKPEYETCAESARVLDAILVGLGYEHLVALTKHCTNFPLTTETGRECLVTVVTVPELEGTFIEVKTLVEEDGLSEGLTVLRGVLADLGIGEDAFTTEQYTDAVIAHRSA
ncbi:class IV adenylate cyclase [Nocardiopsis lambiniae]|uniref:Class IV adenylate cyclase n=1 Tax=Nocardiopsis lambiniae TaxID=3075539 RepID=A0ABU2M2S1_9ACTN|nr:class IV adenylate cyclase [Nocardiopsis sp. DSM 44743]MDT0326944.1 class IV adenylate cyclase [Nocardiopsis sp. DSM 44743]